MHILLTNDDGLAAEGLQAAYGRLTRAGHRVTACAPDRERSAHSQSITLGRPISARPRTMPDGAVGYSISGTPADCAHLGYTTLATSPIDLVVSGINNDTNLGYDVNYSGTVGAAMEAAAAGYPALAVSVEKSESYDWPLAAEILCQAVELYADWAIPSGVLVNLNIPNIISDSTWVWTSANPYHGLDGYRQVSASADEVLEFLRIHNDNQRPPVEGSDVSLSLQGRITLAPIVPMGFDQKTLERLKNFQQVVGGRAVGQKSL